MRILEIAPGFGRGGLERHVLDLSACLRRRGHRVVLAGTPGAWLRPGEDPRFLPIPLRGVAGDHAPTRRLAAFVRCGTAVRLLVREERFDLVHAHEVAPLAVARLAALGGRTPVVLSFHGCEEARVGYYARAARRLADRVITPAHACAARLRAAGVPPERIDVLGYGVAPAAAVAAERVAAARAGALGAGGDFLVATVARLDRQKGLDTLIDAAREVVREEPGVRFAIAGEGPLRDALRAQARRLGLERHVRLLGATDAPAPLLRAADAFVLPSRWEALPLAIVEALRCGLPVVATDVGGVRELVDASVGCLIPPESPARLARELLLLVRSPERRARLSATAVARGAEARFAPEPVHHAYEAAFERAIASGRR